MEPTATCASCSTTDLAVTSLMVCKCHYKECKTCWDQRMAPFKYTPFAAPCRGCQQPWSWNETMYHLLRHTHDVQGQRDALAKQVEELRRELIEVKSHAHRRLAAHAVVHAMDAAIRAAVYVLPHDLREEIPVPLRAALSAPRAGCTGFRVAPAKTYSELAVALNNLAAPAPAPPAPAAPAPPAAPAAPAPAAPAPTAPAPPAPAPVSAQVHCGRARVCELHCCQPQPRRRSRSAAGSEEDETGSDEDTAVEEGAEDHGQECEQRSHRFKRVKVEQGESVVVPASQVVE